MPPAAYWLAMLFPALTLLSLALTGVGSFLGPLVVFGALPLVELWIGERRATLPETELQARARARGFSRIATAVGVAHLLSLGVFAWRVALWEGGWTEVVGWSLSAGTACGACGITIAHELGHRGRALERRLALALLAASWYPHFQMEHNRGHHAAAATPEDPASARPAESLYRFLPRVLAGTLRNALALGAQDAERTGRARFGAANGAVRLVALQLALAALVGVALGPAALAAWMLAGATGVLLLETVDYVEHYGLQRARLADGTYEPFGVRHAWNSDHAVGRCLLFELPRHSDHHAHAARPYPALRNREQAPRLPAGYPAMMLAATLPPVWFRLMDPRLPAGTLPRS